MLDIAERLAQTRGFNGFSYADIAAELGIRKASLHHHFATKVDLGQALMQRYSQAFDAALEAIDRGGDDAFGKLNSYVKLYQDVLLKDRLCLCGMLAAEYGTLPKPMQEQIRRFFEKNEAWLARLIEQGRRAKTLRAGSPARDVARMILSALEGAMLLARSYEDPERFSSCVRPVLAELKGQADRKKATR
jgi:TetR/AcrR family transcriptional repressor of nem operon